MIAAAKRDPAPALERGAVRTLLRMSWPLACTAAIQVFLGLTDAWVVAQLGTEPLAAVAVAHWPTLLLYGVLAGIAQSAQVLVAHADGAAAHADARAVLRTHAWMVVIVAPACAAVAFAGPWLLHAGGVAPDVARLGTEYWRPRIGGLPLGLLLATAFAFWTGLGDVRTPLSIAVVVALANATFAVTFVLALDGGVAGAAHATNLAQASGVALCIARLRADGHLGRAGARVSWPGTRTLVARFGLALPTGLMGTSGIAGVAAIQWMQARVGPVDTAASALAFTLSSVCYVPAAALSLAITTLVGRELGAGRGARAHAVGTYAIRLTAAIMTGAGVLLAVAGGLLVPQFTRADDPDRAQLVTLTLQLLWVAALYQGADGFNAGAVAALRAARDVARPALTAWALSLGVLVPLAHVLSFGTTDGWWRQPWGAGIGALGGWLALAVHVAIMGTLMFVRWTRTAR